MKSSVLYRNNYAFKNAKTALQHRTDDNKWRIKEEEQAKQAEEWNLPEAEDCSSSVIARSIEDNTEDNTEAVPKGKKKVRVSDPVSMKKEPSLESVGRKSSSGQRNRQPAASKHNH